MADINTPAVNTSATRAASASLSSPVYSLSAQVTEVRTSPNRIDPTILARASLEEELKRKGGGGGGGGAVFKSPTLFVLYSMRLINEALLQAYKALQQALAQSAARAVSPLTQAIANAQNALLKIINNNPVINFVSNFSNGVNKNLEQIANAFKNPQELANKILSSFTSLGNLIASAIANGLKKSYTKDEEKLDPNEWVYESEDNLFTGMMSFFGVNNNQESNGKSIKSHIDNIAKQFARWSDAVSYPVREFMQRWFR